MVAYAKGRGAEFLDFPKRLNCGVEPILDSVGIFIIICGFLAYESALNSHVLSVTLF